MEKGRSTTVVPMRPTATKLESRVRDLASVSSNVRWGSHARERMEERGITDRMMFEVLRTGMLRGDISAGANVGEWKCKLVKEMKGRRELGVVTVLVADQKLYVRTVEWEDPK